MNADSSRATSGAPHVHDDPMQVLADTLAELFRQPAEDVIRHVNEQLAANPLTADLRLDCPRRRV